MVLVYIQQKSHLIVLKLATVLNKLIEVIRGAVPDESADLSRKRSQVL